MMRTKDGYEVVSGMWITSDDGTVYEIVRVNEANESATVNKITWISDDGDYTSEFAGILTAKEIASAMYE